MSEMYSPIQIDAALRRHDERHLLPISGCIVCDAREIFHQAVSTWADKQEGLPEALEEMIRPDDDAVKKILDYFGKGEG